MFRFRIKAELLTPITAMISASILSFPALGADKAAIPNFSPNSLTGWIAGAPESETPVGDEFLKPPSGPGPVTFDRAHPFIDNQLARIRGIQPTNRVADLSNPILQPWVVDALRKVNERALSGRDAFPPQVRCWPLGVPGFLLYPVQPVYFIQTRQEVVLIWQADDMVRRIYLADKHSDTIKPSWFGESIGHYESGDTLVVDTIGLNTRTFVDNYRTPHTDKLHVIERFKLMPDAKSIEVTAMIDDPGAFTMPWSAVQRYRRVEQGPLQEVSCAEGNFNYYNFDLEPLPHADKPDF